MSTPLPPEDERLLARLKKHPQLRGRIERLVDLVEDVGGDLPHLCHPSRQFMVISMCYD